MKQVYGIYFPEDDTHFNENMIHPNGDYQRDIFQTAMEYVKEPKIFYDIGAHVGLWSMMAIRAGFKTIHAYEPNPKTFACLRKNLANKNREYNAFLNPFGISQCNKNLEIIEEHIGNSGAVKVLENDESGNTFSCSINNTSIHEDIDAFNIRPHETLVKIDTEGMEEECVLGMDKILYALRPVVCVEQRTNEDALKILQQMGMVIQKKVRKDWILTWKDQ